MSYFDAIPARWVTLGGSTVLLTNITKRVSAKQDIKSSTMFITYQIKDGERPDILANRLYDNPNYWWIFLLVNEKYDLCLDWPLNDNELTEYINSQYADPYATHHYVDKQGTIIDPEVQNETTIWKSQSNVVAHAIQLFKTGLSEVTNTEYETALNDEKRIIRVLDPDFLDLFVSQYEELMDG